MENNPELLKNYLVCNPQMHAYNNNYSHKDIQWQNPACIKIHQNQYDDYLANQITLGYDPNHIVTYQNNNLLSVTKLNGVMPSICEGNNVGYVAGPACNYNYVWPHYNDEPIQYTISPQCFETGLNVQSSYVTNKVHQNKVAIQKHPIIVGMNSNLLTGKAQNIVTKLNLVMSNNSGNYYGKNVAGSANNDVYLHSNNNSTHCCNTLPSIQNTITINSNKQVQAQCEVSNKATFSNTRERISSSSIMEKTGNLESNNVEANNNLMPPADKRYDYKNSIINILFGIEGRDTYISNKVYEILYYSGYPRKKVIHGITHIEVNFKDVKRAFPKISKLKICYIDFYTGNEYSDKSQSISITGLKESKCDLWVNTNVDKNFKYIIQLSFIDENNEEKFRIRFLLVTDKKRQREYTDKGVNENEDPIKECIKEEENDASETPTKGFHNRENKIKGINDFLEVLKNNNFDFLDKFNLSELEKDKSLKEDIKKLNKELKKSKISKINTKKTLKEIIVDIYNHDNIENKNNLLILCFNIIYKSIINNAFYDENCIIMCLPHYKKFIKNYNIGYSRINDIVIMDDEDIVEREDIQDKMKTINEDEKNNKRKYPREEEIFSEESNGKRLRKNILSRDGSKQTNKNSDVEVLLVDR